MANNRKKKRTERLVAHVTPELRERVEMERLNMERQTGARQSLSNVIAALLEKGLATYWR